MSRLPLFIQQRSLFVSFQPLPASALSMRRSASPAIALAQRGAPALLASVTRRRHGTARELASTEPRPSEWRLQSLAWASM